MTIILTPTLIYLEFGDPCRAGIGRDHFTLVSLEWRFIFFGQSKHWEMLAFFGLWEALEWDGLGGFGWANSGFHLNYSSPCAFHWAITRLSLVCEEDTLHVLKSKKGEHWRLKIFYMLHRHIKSESRWKSSRCKHCVKDSRPCEASSYCFEPWSAVATRWLPLPSLLGQTQEQRMC